MFTKLKTLVFCALLAVSSLSTATAQTTSLENIQVDCIARAIYGEARGEGSRGMIAVANVIMNRTEARGFPRSACEVIEQPGQFTFPRNARVNRATYEMAAAVYYGNLIDLTNGATYYHANYVHPRWANRLTRVATIGHHIFYR